MENANFASLTYEKQLDVLTSYAEEIIAANNTETEITNSLKKTIGDTGEL